MNKHKKILLIILIVSAVLASGGGSFCIGYFLFRSNSKPYISLEKNKSMVVPASEEESDRQVELEAEYRDIQNINDITTTIFSTTVNGEDYFEPLTGDNGSTPRILALKSTVDTVDSDFDVTISIAYKNVSAQQTIEVMDGILLSSLFTVTDFNYGDYAAHDYAPGYGPVLNYVFDSKINPKLTAVMTKDDLHGVSGIENGWRFNCPELIQGEAYFGHVDITYNVDTKPNLSQVITENQYLDLGRDDGTPYFFPGESPSIQDIKGRFEDKFGGTQGYNQGRIIYWYSENTKYLDVVSNLDEYTATVSVTTNGEQYYDNSQTLVFKNVSGPEA